MNLHNNNSRKKQDADRHGTAIGAQRDTTSPQKKLDANKHEKAIRAQQKTDSPQKTIRVLLNTGSSGDLLFMKKGTTMCIPVVRRSVPESLGTSSGTFQTKKVGNVKISFVDYSDSKRIHLKPDIADYARNGALLLYNLILGKQTLHNLGVVLNFKEKNPHRWDPLAHEEYQYSAAKT